MQSARVKTTTTVYETAPRFRCLIRNLLLFSASIVTPKFYTLKNVELVEEQEKEVEILIKKLENLNEVGPREKYKEPVLESHR